MREECARSTVASESMPGETRDYASFSEAADEASQARYTVEGISFGHS